MVSLSTILCPTCPSHPSFPKGHMGHQGTSHGVPQHNSLSHVSIPSLSPQGTYGTSRDVPWCPSAQFSVPPVHPIPESPRDIWDIKGRFMVSLSTILCPTCPSHPSVPKGHMGHQGTSHGVPHHNPLFPIPQSPRNIRDIKGCPMVSFSTILCPTCPSHPSFPKGHMGHQGMSHGVPQHSSLSHLSIPFLSPQGTYGTSRDVPWCPSAQFSVPPVDPIPQSPRDIWDIKGRPMVSLSTILCPTCPSIEFSCTIL